VCVCVGVWQMGVGVCARMPGHTRTHTHTPPHQRMHPHLSACLHLLAKSTTPHSQLSDTSRTHLHCVCVCVCTFGEGGVRTCSRAAWGVCVCVLGVYFHRFALHAGWFSLQTKSNTSYPTAWCCWTLGSSVWLAALPSSIALHCRLKYTLPASS
jgi:hypothetical protein